MNKKIAQILAAGALATPGCRLGQPAEIAAPTQAQAQSVSITVTDRAPPTQAPDEEWQRYLLRKLDKTLASAALLRNSGAWRMEGDSTFLEQNKSNFIYQLRLLREDVAEKEFQTALSRWPSVMRLAPNYSAPGESDPDAQSINADIITPLRDVYRSLREREDTKTRAAKLASASIGRALS